MIGPIPPFRKRLWCLLVHRALGVWGEDFLGAGFTLRCYRCGIGWPR